jgi:hypothetical protein
MGKSAGLMADAKMLLERYVMISIHARMIRVIVKEFAPISASIFPMQLVLIVFEIWILFVPLMLNVVLMVLGGLVERVAHLLSGVMLDTVRSVAVVQIVPMLRVRVVTPST